MTCTLTIEGVFIDLVVLLSGDKDGVRGGTVADALHVAVGQATGTETFILDGRDTPFDAVDGEAEHEEAVFLGLVAHQSITTIAQGRYPAVVTRGQHLVKALGLLCHRRQTTQQQEAKDSYHTAKVVVFSDVKELIR